MSAGHALEESRRTVRVEDPTLTGLRQPLRSAHALLVVLDGLGCVEEMAEDDDEGEEEPGEM